MPKPKMLKSIMGGDKSRNAYIAGGFFVFLILVIVIMWVISLGSKSSDESKSQMSRITGRQDVATGENKAYTKQIEKFNARKADEAAKSGSSWISIPAYYDIKLNDPQRDERATRAPRVTPSQEPQDLVAVKPGMKPANIARQEAQELLAQLSTSWTYSEPSDAPMRTTPEYAQSIIPAVTSNASLNAAAPVVAPTVAPFRLYEAFKICPARSLVKLDTNTNSAVRATLICKELANATIFASGYKLVGEDIDMTFSMMTYKGETYKIQAKPVDLDTGRTMLSANINNNYIRRILIPALARATQKVGNLYEKQSDSTTYVSNGTIVTDSSGKVDADQVRGTFVGGLAEQTAKVLEADNARVPPVQATRDESTFGVTFLAPVMSTDALIKGGQSAPAIPQQPAAQQQMDAQRQEMQQSNFITPTSPDGNGPVFGSGPIQIN
jgi:intracellular multiplication protein IcmE